MINERQYLKDNLYDVFAAILEEEGCALQIIFEDQNGTRPPAPFLSIKFGPTVGQGATMNFTRVKLPVTDGVADTDADGVQTASQPFRRTMTCYGFGEAAQDVLETLRAQLQIDKWVDELKRRHLVIPQVMEAIPTYSEIDVVRETAGGFDFDLTYIRVIETVPGWIEDVELTPEYVLAENNSSVGG
ncbi:hypothetical protein AGMMS49944_09180 [Spirochaetia bacterium]|nr:hypothetical protein AGMMS49944_09180 [Spirochaetia bacterium]